jgi:His-Xaa-Ser system protein HxsD
MFPVNNIMPEKREPISIDKKRKEATILVSTKVYPPEVIYSAAYVFLDKAHFLFDGDMKADVTITVKPKEKNIDLMKLCLDFNNELINYSVYAIQSAKKQAIREAIIKRALATNIKSDESETYEEEWIDDPEGIAKPWSPEDAKGTKPE